VPLGAETLSPQAGISLLNDGNYHSIVAGKQVGKTIMRKFGANSEVGTSWEPITSSATYQTPTTAQTVEIVSDDNTNDKAGGVGALKVMIVGLGADWYEQEEEVTLNGTTAVALTKSFTRIFRMYVTESGTYATPSAVSHNSTITVQSTGAGVVWATIETEESLGMGQSQIGVYTVPKGKRAFILTNFVTVETTKVVTLAMFQRPNTDDVTTPFSSRKLMTLQRGTSGVNSFRPRGAINGIIGPTDIGFMAHTSVGTAQVSVEFEVLMVDIVE